MMTRAFCPLLLALVLGSAAAAVSDDQVPDLAPGEPIEYQPFFPNRWQARQQSTRLVPWEGQRVVLLTTTAELDSGAMSVFLKRLDGGWKVYADLIGRSPAPNRQYRGKVTIAAVPDASYTCGIGCGYLGAGGIEVGGFYQGDYPLVRERPDAFAHYYFYEMGRNYFVFGGRHSEFATGFAVFMRYVCMDALKCQDPDVTTREAIEQAEANLGDTRLTFLQAFTNSSGLSEKMPRLSDLSPSDQPVMYASAMLKLRRDHGGDAWVQRFFRHLARCPAVPADSQDGALAQSLSWLIAASCAAGQDLSGEFVDRWRMPLGPELTACLGTVDWKADDVAVQRIIAGLPAGQAPAVRLLQDALALQH